jgi:hypothetical protein
MTSTAFDKAKSTPAGLPPYNTIYQWFFTETFMGMTDFNILLEPRWWKQEDGSTGTSPFDANMDGDDLLSPKLLEYFDFLVAHAPFNRNTSSTAVTLGIDADVLGDMHGCAKEHSSDENVLALGTMVKAYYGKRGAVAAELAREEDAPAKRSRRELFNELSASAATPAARHSV